MKDKRFTYSNAEYLKALNDLAVCKNIIETYEKETKAVIYKNHKYSKEEAEIWELKEELNTLQYRTREMGWDDVRDIRSRWRREKINKLLKQAYKK